MLSDRALLLILDCIYQIHLYMVDIKGDITFNESEGFSTGSEFCFVDIDGKKVGIGICNDIRYDEFVRVFRNEGM